MNWLLRPLLRRPAFTWPAIVGLALGIGASTTVFSVFAAMMLESMGIRDSAHLASVWLTDPAHGQQQVEVSYADWQAWSRTQDVFAGIALASSVNLDFALRTAGAPEHVDGNTVTGNFFDVLGATPFAGRFLTEADDRAGQPLPSCSAMRFGKRGSAAISILWAVRFASAPATQR